MTSYPPPGQTPPPGQYPPPPPPPPAFAPQQGPQQYGHPADPPRVSPPPPPVTQTAPVQAPPVAWLVPLAALLAVIGAFTPWFRPHGEAGGASKDFDNLYSWKDGKIGLVAPIILVILAISVIGLLQGKARGRFASGPDPVRSVAKYCIGAGVVSLVCLLIAWFLVTSQYKFQVPGRTYSWDDFEKLGVTLSRGPQIGYWLTLVAGVLAIVGGVLMLLAAKPVPVSPSGAFPPPQNGAFPPAQTGAFPPAQNGAFPPLQNGGYPQGGYPAQTAYPPAGPSLHKPDAQMQRPPA